MPQPPRHLAQVQQQLAALSTNPLTIPSIPVAAAPVLPTLLGPTDNVFLHGLLTNGSDAPARQTVAQVPMLNVLATQPQQSLYNQASLSPLAVAMATQMMMQGFQNQEVLTLQSLASCNSPVISTGNIDNIIGSGMYGNFGSSHMSHRYP